MHANERTNVSHIACERRCTSTTLDGGGGSNGGGTRNRTRRGRMTRRLRALLLQYDATKKKNDDRVHSDPNASAGGGRWRADEQLLMRLDRNASYTRARARASLHGGRRAQIRRVDSRFDAKKARDRNKNRTRNWAAIFSINNSLRFFNQMAC